MDGLKSQVGESVCEGCLVCRSLSYHIRCIMQVVIIASRPGKILSRLHLERQLCNLLDFLLVPSPDSNSHGGTASSSRINCSSTAQIEIPQHTFNPSLNIRPSTLILRFFLSPDNLFCFGVLLQYFTELFPGERRELLYTD